LLDKGKSVYVGVGDEILAGNNALQLTVCQSNSDENNHVHTHDSDVDLKSTDDTNQERRIVQTSSTLEVQANSVQPSNATPTAGRQFLFYLCVSVFKSRLVTHKMVVVLSVHRRQQHKAQSAIIRK
jgi:hypothetical protein